LKITFKIRRIISLLLLLLLYWFIDMLSSTLRSCSLERYITHLPLNSYFSHYLVSFSSTFLLLPPYAISLHSMTTITIDFLEYSKKYLKRYSLLLITNLPPTQTKNPSLSWTANTITIILAISVVMDYHDVKVAYWLMLFHSSKLVNPYNFLDNFLCLIRCISQLIADIP